MSEPIVARDARRELQTQVLDLRGYDGADQTTGLDPAQTTELPPEDYGYATEEFYGESPAPAPRGFGGPFGVVLALLATAGMATALVLAPEVVQTQAGDAFRTVFSLEGPRGIAHWWSVVLPVIVAAWCWAACQRAFSARRFGRSGGWAWMGFSLLAVSAAVALDLPEVLREVVLTPAVADQLPAWVAHRPVEVLLGLVSGIGVLVLLAACRAEQKLMLVFAVLLVVVGVGMGRGVLELPVSDLPAEVATHGAFWGAALLVMVAAALERRW